MRQQICRSSFASKVENPGDASPCLNIDSTVLQMSFFYPSIVQEGNYSIPTLVFCLVCGHSMQARHLRSSEASRLGAGGRQAAVIQYKL